MIRQMGAILNKNQVVIRVTGNTFEFETVAGQGLPEAAAGNRQIQIIFDWNNIDARFSAIRIYDFYPDKPNPNDHTVTRGTPVAMFTFPHNPARTEAVGVKYAVEFKGSNPDDTVTIDPGLIVKP